MITDLEQKVNRVVYAEFWIKNPH